MPYHSQLEDGPIIESYLRNGLQRRAVVSRRGASQRRVCGYIRQKSSPLASLLPECPCVFRSVRARRLHKRNTTPHKGHPHRPALHVASRDRKNDIAKNIRGQNDRQQREHTETPVKWRRIHGLARGWIGRRWVRSAGGRGRHRTEHPGERLLRVLQLVEGFPLREPHDQAGLLSY